MLTRDGIRLDADIYRPETKEKLPILLMRQPYGKAIASTVVYAHPRWYASQGYIVVIQDVRGRGTSNGDFELFANEVNDGIDTIDWVSQLPDSTGEVGMYGFSYQGMTQLYAAIGKSSALKAIAPAMIGYDLYSDWAYENGAFCLQANLGWAIQLAAETARLQGDEIAFQKLYQASRNQDWAARGQGSTPCFPDGSIDPPFTLKASSLNAVVSQSNQLCRKKTVGNVGTFPQKSGKRGKRVEIQYLHDFKNHFEPFTMQGF